MSGQLFGIFAITRSNLDNGTRVKRLYELRLRLALGKKKRVSQRDVARLSVTVCLFIFLWCVFVCVHGFSALFLHLESLSRFVSVVVSFRFVSFVLFVFFSFCFVFFSFFLFLFFLFRFLFLFFHFFFFSFSFSFRFFSSCF